MNKATTKENTAGSDSRAPSCSRSSVSEEDATAWTDFIRAAQRLERTLSGEHTLHKLILNDIDHRAQDVRLAIDASKYFWRFDLKKERPGAIVLPAPDSSANDQAQTSES